MATIERENKFELGRLLATPGALRAVERTGSELLHYLQRHWRGDWGEVCEADRRENEYSLNRDLRLLSAYRLADGTKIWIITEADRSATTVLLPEEY